MEKSHGIFIKAKIRLKNFFFSINRCIKKFFCSFRLLLNNNKKNYWTYVILIMSITSSTLLCFSGTTSNYSKLWSNVLAISEEVKQNNYVGTALYSSPFTASSEEKTDWENCTVNVNRNISSIAASLIMSSNKDGALLSYDVYIGDELVEKKTVGDAISYYSESVADQMSAINIIRYDVTMTGVSFNSYPFKNKDGSSYIPSSLADKMISLNANDSLTSYDDLLGLQYKIIVGTEEKLFSINNIYYEDKNMGPFLKKAMYSPIITNSKSIFNYEFCSSFSIFSNEPIFLRRGYRFYSVPYQKHQETGVNLKYVSTSSELINTDMEKSTLELLETYKDGQILLPFSGANLSFMIFAFVIYAACGLVVCLLRKLGKINYEGMFYTSFLQFSFSVLLFFVLLIFLHHSLMMRYLILNPLTFFGFGLIPTTNLMISFVKKRGITKND